MKEMMQECMTKCKWCPWVMIIAGVVLLLLGLFFSAAVIKGLWMIIAIVIILLGIYCFYMMQKKGCCKTGGDSCGCKDKEKEEK